MLHQQNLEAGSVRPERDRCGTCRGKTSVVTVPVHDVLAESAEEATAAPLVGLVLTAAVLVSVGLAGIGARDVPTS